MSQISRGATRVASPSNRQSKLQISIFIKCNRLQCRGRAEQSLPGSAQAGEIYDLLKNPSNLKMSFP